MRELGHVSELRSSRSGVRRGRRGARRALVLGILSCSVLACAARTFEADEFGNFGDSEDEIDGSTDDESSSTESTSTGSTSTSESTTEESTSTDGSGLPDGSNCTSDDECMSNNCYVVLFLGGQCGECNEDADCPDGGCTPANPFEAKGPFCNLGELGGGCESTDVCMPGLVCGNALDLLGLIQINSCGRCEDDSACADGQICAPLTDIAMFSGANDCIDPGSLPQDAFCALEGNGNQACASGMCSTIDVRGLTQMGACGECNTDADCNGGTCVFGEFNLDSGTLTGSTCQ